MAFMKLLAILGQGILVLIAIAVLVIMVAFVLELIRVFWGKGGKGNQ